MKAFADFNRDAFQRVTYSHVVSEAKQCGVNISMRDLVEFLRDYYDSERAADEYIDNEISCEVDYITELLIGMFDYHGNEHLADAQINEIEAAEFTMPVDTACYIIDLLQKRGMSMVSLEQAAKNAQQRGLSISARDLVTAVICFDSSDVIDQVIASHACTGDLGKQWRVQRMQ